MHHLRTLIALACLAVFANANAQNVPCPGETLTFQLEDEYYGTKTWEYSTDGVTWNTVDVVENAPFILQPEQSGWYRVRFFDEACGINYVSEAQRFAAHAIDPGEVITLSIGGVVRNEMGGPVSGATVRAGCGDGEYTTTDYFGVFLLEEVSAYEGLAHVTVEKPGYFTGSRTFVPSDSAQEAISHAYITLLPKNSAGIVQSVSGGQVSAEGVTITFPANAFTQNGAPYSGSVQVYLNHIDPTGDDLHGQMPGMLLGVQDDQPQLLHSYGMAGVELTDAVGNPVQLASGSSATVRFPVMTEQQADAPASIPLWWFDENLGYWVEEGEAQRVGNEYEGQVAHFSWWNIDVPANFVTLKGTVFGSVTGAVLSGARIIVVTPNLGSGITYADTKGEFAGLVPIGQELTIQVQLPCGPNGSWVTVHTEVVGPFTQPSLISLSVALPAQKLVIGTVVDCNSVPVTAGYVWVNGGVHFCVEGAFEFSTCLSSITLRGVDGGVGNASELTTIELPTDTTHVGELVACTPLFGTVMDIDGNNYQTVVIGTQEWMAENLKTTRYRDGSTIPNVTDNTEWRQLNSGAWCNYDNSPVNDATYGKLYNWYAAANPNLCPQGWHVPTDAEWTVLINYLGGENVAGGKMKSVSPLWGAPNTGATNESGFSGLPGGNRSGSVGTFDFLGSFGYWWSASESGAEFAWYRFLYGSNADIYRGSISKRSGFCVRCVRD